MAKSHVHHFVDHVLGCSQDRAYRRIHGIYTEVLIMVENKLMDHFPLIALTAFVLVIWNDALSIVKSYQEIFVNQQMIELNEYELAERRLDNLFHTR